MSETQTTKTVEQTAELKSLITCYDALSWAHYKMQHTAFLLEEAPHAQAFISVAAQFCSDFKKKITEIDPTLFKAPEKTEAKPYVMDLSHVTAADANEPA